MYKIDQLFKDYTNTIIRVTLDEITSIYKSYIHFQNMHNRPHTQRKSHMPIVDDLSLLPFVIKMEDKDTISLIIIFYCL